jgi:hypothetical protein
LTMIANSVGSNLELITSTKNTNNFVGILPNTQLYLDTTRNNFLIFTATYELAFSLRKVLDLYERSDH